MTKRGRKPLDEPSVPWKCQIPEKLAMRVELLLLDPVKGAPIYGARSALVTQLLRAYMAQFEKTGVVAPLAETGDN